MITKPHRVLYDKDQIDGMVEELAFRISCDYAGKEVVIIGILKGSLLFMSDIVKKIDLEIEIDFFTASSYAGGMQSQGSVKILRKPDINVRGKHVILVEDIVDTGLTINEILKLITADDPESVQICAMLVRQGDATSSLEVKYSGFPLTDGFVVGYGLDLNEKYRNLNFIAELI